MTPDERERLTRMEETQKFHGDKLDIQAQFSRETRDEIRDFRRELFRVINPMNQTVSKHGESISWLKRYAWTGVPALLAAIKAMAGSDAGN